PAGAVLCPRCRGSARSGRPTPRLASVALLAYFLRRRAQGDPGSRSQGNRAGESAWMHARSVALSSTRFMIFSAAPRSACARRRPALHRGGACPLCPEPHDSAGRAAANPFSTLGQRTVGLNLLLGLSFVVPRLDGLDGGRQPLAEDVLAAGRQQERERL